MSYFYLPAGVPVTVDFDQHDFLYGWSLIESVASKIRQGIQNVIAGSPVVVAFPPNSGERCRMCPIRNHCSVLMVSGRGMPADLQVSDELNGGAA
ncbi:hypothetical protein D3C72_2183130 [compost metagenome]